MKIKNKLLIGFGILFLVVVFFGIVAVYYIENISEFSKVTVKNNYETLTFTRLMRSVLDENDLPLPLNAAKTFENALKKQENNITEPGEKQATADLRNSYTLLTASPGSVTDKLKAEKNIRFELKTIDGLNMKAIVAKNNYIHETVSNATLYLGAIVFVTFLILFIFIVNFPGFILNPLNEFIEGVREVNRKHYNTRLEFKTNDEFAELAVEFNELASNLEKRENDSLKMMLSAENQVKILSNEIADAIVAVNENQEVIFVNNIAKKVLETGEMPVRGRRVKDIVKSNELLKAIAEKDMIKSVLSMPVNGKAHQFQLKKFEIVIPNLKSQPPGTLQFSGFPAGMIYILKDLGVKETEKEKII